MLPYIPDLETDVRALPNKGLNDPRVHTGGSVDTSAPAFSRKPRLLDLFCGAGGAGMGYHQAGFEVVGVDIKPQPRYPFEFIQADALTLDREFVAGFDAIHASPPCQAFTDLRHRTGKQYLDLIDPTRALLKGATLPYVIENVERAPLLRSLRLCGTHFGLSADCWDGKHRYLKRHRLFETNFPISGRGACVCRWQSIAGVYGNGGGGSMRRGYKFGLKDGSKAMGINWMRQAELSQAIPPAYTRFIGERLIKLVRHSLHDLRSQNPERDGAAVSGDGFHARNNTSESEHDHAG